MASYPPPYPPPPGAPYGYDAKQQRRWLRDQMRAQNQAHKAASRAVVQAAAAQRAAYRQQVRAMRRSSILGPVVILAIGVVALLIRTGRLPLHSFANWYGRWWPLLLVGAGVVLVIEWAFDQMPRPDAAPYVRRGIGGGAIVLLILLAVTGACAAAYHNDDYLLQGLSINPDNVDEIFGEKHEMSQPVDEDLPVGGGLVIDNPHGDVTVVGASTDGKLHMIVNKQVWTRSDEAADEKAQKLNPSIGHFTDTVAGVAVSNALTVQIPALPGASADLSITMPEGAKLTVTANHGSVNVSAMRAPVTVTANHGDVELNSIAGAVTAHLNHSDASFTAHSVAGDVTVRGHAQDLNITDVTGQVSMEGEFFGETHLQHLAGPVNFRTSRTQFLAGQARRRGRHQPQLGAYRQPDRRSYNPSHLQPQYLLRPRRRGHPGGQQQGLGRRHQRSAAGQCLHREPRRCGQSDLARARRRVG